MDPTGPTNNPYPLGHHSPTTEQLILAAVAYVSVVLLSVAAACYILWRLVS